MEKDDLKKTFTGYWNYLAIRAACELKLFDRIDGSQHTIDTLVQNTQWNAKAVEALIQICQDEGLLHIEPYIVLTTKGQYLVSTNAEGLYNACLLWAGEHLNAWQQMASVIQSGQPAFEKIYGLPFFQYIGKHPQKLKDYHAAMHEYAIDDYRDIGHQLNLQGIKSLLDVGGGFGALIGNIKDAHPDIHCGLFDLPEVVSNVQNKIIQLHSGTFFEGLPSGYDAIIMSRVIHDWDDLHANLILKNVHNALPIGGKLFILENLTNRLSNKASGLTLNMMAMCKSYERSESEYLALLERNGFENLYIQKINQTQYNIQSTKI